MFRRNNSTVLYSLSDKERSDLKACLVEMYKDFARVCEKYSLTFMLGGGSALGAVRHRGFVPWDDDLDLLMPRKDYNKFIQIFAEELASDYYLYAPNSNYDVSNTFGKMVKKNTTLVDIHNVTASFQKGVSLDIFPIENAPNNKIIRRTKGLLADVIGYLAVSRFLYTHRNPVTKDFFYSTVKGAVNYNIRLILGICSSFASYETWYNFYDKFVQQERSSDFCTVPTGRRHYVGEVLDRNTFFPAQHGQFEGLTVYLPNDVDRYLSNLYGDYMELPPIERREGHHFVGFKI